MQNTLRKPKDIEKLGNQIKLTDFDYALEFSRILYMFVKIIDKEVVQNPGFSTLASTHWKIVALSQSCLAKSGHVSLF